MTTSQMRKNNGKHLLAPFISSFQYDFWARQLGSTSAWSRCFARVAGRVDEAENTFTLRLEPNRNFAGFVSGQHVNITAQVNGRRITRSYSFSNTPSGDGYVELTIRHDPNGLMSNWLYANAFEGSILELGNVFGGMTAATFTGAPLLLLAAGSGITPLISLLREQANLGMPSPVTLVYWERKEASLCFTDELSVIARQFNNVRIHTVVTSQVSDQRISAAQLHALDINTNECQVLACGGNAFVERAQQCLTSSVLSFQAEAFTPPQSAQTDESVQEFTIELLKSGRSIKISNQHSLLDALEQRGIAVEAGCRMGICNTCSCVKSSGTTRHTGSNEADSEGSTSVRLCIARAASDLQLAL
jgi:ferredoxin-NADP reductase